VAPSAFHPSPKFPPTGVVETDVVNAHAHSIDHRRLLAQSERCGCFHCLSIFTPDAITRWTDEVNGQGVTALCPRCGIDSVIGSASGFPVERGFLDRMRQHWMRTEKPNRP
jgi:hypothetical protein